MRKFNVFHRIHPTPDDLPDEQFEKRLEEMGIKSLGLSSNYAYFKRHHGQYLLDESSPETMDRYLFENDGFDVRGRITSRINTQVAQYLPFLEIRDITFGPTMDQGHQDMDNNTLKLSVVYTILPLAIEDILQINVNSSSY